MPKSKNRKDHKKKLNIYKAKKKKEQELLKKKMIDNYTKMQQKMLENQEAHSSVEEVTGPEINIDELNANIEELNIEEFELNLEKSIVENVEFSDAKIIDDEIIKENTIGDTVIVNEQNS